MSDLSALQSTIWNIILREWRSDPYETNIYNVCVRWSFEKGQLNEICFVKKTIAIKLLSVTNKTIFSLKNK